MEIFIYIYLVLIIHINGAKNEPPLLSSSTSEEHVDIHTTCSSLDGFDFKVLEKWIYRRQNFSMNKETIQSHCFRQHLPIFLENKLKETQEQYNQYIQEIKQKSMDQYDYPLDFDKGVSILSSLSCFLIMDHFTFDYFQHIDDYKTLQTQWQSFYQQSSNFLNEMYNNYTNHVYQKFVLSSSSLIRSISDLPFFLLMGKVSYEKPNENHFLFPIVLKLCSKTSLGRFFSTNRISNQFQNQRIEANILIELNYIGFSTCVISFQHLFIRPISFKSLETKTDSLEEIISSVQMYKSKIKKQIASASYLSYYYDMALFNAWKSFQLMYPYVIPLQHHPQNISTNFKQTLLMLEEDMKEIEYLLNDQLSEEIHFIVHQLKEDLSELEEILRNDDSDDNFDFRIEKEKMIHRLGFLCKQKIHLKILYYEKEIKKEKTILTHLNSFTKNLCDKHIHLSNHSILSYQYLKSFLF